MSIQVSRTFNILMQDADTVLHVYHHLTTTWLSKEAKKGVPSNCPVFVAVILEFSKVPTTLLTMFFF